ncbi:ring finger domain containing protein [Nitzschia inconspicua]|uniref:RING-type E3 ubiquitin transferase n=1 Tax=Nitzschia inconspicua TaxID=303405 RepID=A0A9K3KNQ4_9STRA|nr:ring finger domain containing protein [Nitzschia inconspicua]
MPTIARLNDNPTGPGENATNPNALNNNPQFDPWGASPLGVDGGVGGGGRFNEAQAMWRERERRHRSIRVLTMFLLMLLLMDGEEQQKQRQRRNGENGGGLRKKKKHGGKDGAYDDLLDLPLYHARRTQDETVQKRLWGHPRYLELQAKNGGQDFDLQVRQWAEQRQELQKDEFPPMLESDLGPAKNPSVSTPSDQGEVPDLSSEILAWHYPWNVTGFYRGDWSRAEIRPEDDINRSDYKYSDSPTTPKKKVHPVDAELTMLDVLQQKEDPSLGVHLLPGNMELELPNMTSLLDDSEISDAASTSRRTEMSHYQSPFLRGTTSTGSTQTTTIMGADHNLKDTAKDAEEKLTLTKSSGRAAFQLFTRTVPGMKELSLVDGFVKLYDSNTVGYSTRKDLLLRVHGILIHSLGRMSLVANIQSPGRAALVISGNGDSNEDKVRENRRRLEELLKKSSDGAIFDLNEIRETALRLYNNLTASDTVASSIQRISSLDFSSDEREKEETNENLHRALKEAMDATPIDDTVEANITVGKKAKTYNYSRHVIPFPFIWDDEEQSLQRHRLPSTTRTMPPREQLLEANAGSCEFEINMNIQEEKWNVGQWRKLVTMKLKEAIQLDPSNRRNNMEDDNNQEAEAPNKIGAFKHKKKNKQISKPQGSAKSDLEQALVMTINGTIISPACGFVASVNATAIRTDWEHTTGKAINYSFYMMLTCLTQIVLLLRQLLHTQAQSAATRVSLMCIGWQTVVDALLCLVHIYLSLAMQPLFSAFASVAFFKLLIFCVIEMKYMAIIIQARNASNGGNTIELLRRQIAMLHLRFYVALMASCLGFFYSGETYRTAYMLLLYSFWVPQIVHNVVTEAKRPLHQYYVYGMSVSRLVAPLYIFGVKNNFLKEVYPESPTNVFMCQLLVLWVGIQAGVLEAQGRYGARFMIPARFLPPKFDYNRPIPSSLLSSVAQGSNPTEELRNERASPTTEVRALVVPKRDKIPFTGGARNRMKGSKRNRAESGMTAETVTAIPKSPSMPKFDCVICYNEIDIANRTGYMLAPCEHLFHKDCLVQWMEVKMECPICRATLPPL